MSSYQTIALDFVKKLDELMSNKSFRFKHIRSEDIPKKPGFYVIFDERGEVIYVWRPKTFVGVCWGDHRRGNVGGSQFRKALMQNYGFMNEEQVDNYVDRCTFRFKEIEDPQERIRMEHFATAILAPILNMKLKQ